ncbi:hypothetical protein [Streptomyces sp. YGL11-2]|uniref:hypothetical protein n=1 Tax=Streptomyces sp. YGL11-2 TaxID=3414028 RepID=UPI003CF2B311
MHRLNFAELAELASRFEAEPDALGPWADAALFSRSTLRLNPEQLRAFFEECIALLYRFSPADGEAGVRRAGRAHPAAGRTRGKRTRSAGVFNRNRAR